MTLYMWDRDVIYGAYFLRALCLLHPNLFIRVRPELRLLSPDHYSLLFSISNPFTAAVTDVADRFWNPVKAFGLFGRLFEISYIFLLVLDR